MGYDLTLRRGWEIERKTLPVTHSLRYGLWSCAPLGLGNRTENAACDPYLTLWATVLRPSGLTTRRTARRMESYFSSRRQRIPPEISSCGDAPPDPRCTARRQEFVTR